MKKLIHIFIFITLTLCTYSQSPFNFSGLNIETIGLNPQTGQYNFFGVKVTLSQTYDQNITISGYIYENGNYNTNHPFSLTVTAGNTTAQTANTFYQTNPAVSASASLSSISPSVVTSGGISYNTEGSPGSAIDYLNSAGQLHNDFQAYLFDFILSQNINLFDTSNTKQIIQSKAQEFFSAHGVNYFPPSSYSLATTGTSFSESSFTGYSFSSQGASIMSSLRTLMNNYDPDYDDSFFSSLNTLQSEALSLSGPEVYTVGLPVTVAIYSFNFWKSHGDSILTALDYQDSVRSSNYVAMNYYNHIDQLTNKNRIYAPQNVHGPNATLFEDSRISMLWAPPYRANVKKMAAADVVGAVSGGFNGLALGPGGALAGAILVSAASSSYSLVNDFISSKVSWWPF